MQTRLRAEQSGNPVAEVALEHFGQVEATLAFFASLGRSRIGEFFNPLGDDGWVGLKVLSALLPAEPYVDDDDRESLLKQTRALIDAVVGSDLDPDEKLQLTAALQEVVDALLRAQITGTGPLEHTVDAMTGSLIRVIMRRGQAFMQHPVTQGVLTLAQAFSVALAMGADYQALSTGPLGKMLGLPGGGP